MPIVEIISFGYGHAPAPEAHFVVDVRDHFKDPHVNPALRRLTAADPEVAQAVMGTRGVPELVDATVDIVHAFRRGPQPGPIRIAVGCVGGRHRSAQIATEAADRLRADGVEVTLTHRDIDKQVIRRPAHKGSAGKD